MVVLMVFGCTVLVAVVVFSLDCGCHLLLYFFVSVIVVLFLTRASRVHLLLWKVQGGLEERIADSVFNQYQRISCF